MKKGTQARFCAGVPFEFYEMGENEKVKIPNAVAFGIFGAADRDRTGTVFLPRDFKSLASACSATAACKRQYSV